MRSDAAMKAHLHHAPAIARGVKHRAAFVDGVAGRLFDEHVRASLKGVDRLQRVPVIRRGDNDDFWFFINKNIFFLYSILIYIIYIYL